MVVFVFFLNVVFAASTIFGMDVDVFKNILKEERNYFSLGSSEKQNLDFSISNILRDSYKGKNIQSELHAPLLFWAISAARFDICKEIVESNGVDINAEDGDDKRILPLLYLIQRIKEEEFKDRLIKIFNFFIEKNADFLRKTDGINAPIACLLYLGFTSNEDYISSMISKLIDKIEKDGPTIGVFDLSDGMKRSLLHWAANFDLSGVMCKKLLDVGANVNAHDEKGRTPLHFAASVWNKAAVLSIIDAGGNVMAKDENSSTPLHSAILHRKINQSFLLEDKDDRRVRFEETFKMLIEKNADIFFEDKSHKSTIGHVFFLHNKFYSNNFLKNRCFIFQKIIIWIAEKFLQKTRLDLLIKEVLFGDKKKNKTTILHWLVKYAFVDVVLGISLASILDMISKIPEGFINIEDSLGNTLLDIVIQRRDAKGASYISKENAECIIKKLEERGAISSIKDSKISKEKSPSPKPEAKKESFKKKLAPIVKDPLTSLLDELKEKLVILKDRLGHMAGALGQLKKSLGGV